MAASAIPPIFNQDFGLGYCLQCLGEYKQSGEADPFPNWACCYAPCPVGVIAVCYEHIVTNQPPSTLTRANGPLPDLIGIDQSRQPIIPSTSNAQHRRLR